MRRRLRWLRRERREGICAADRGSQLPPPNNQLEGKKEWKIYPPRSEEETLPRFSSSDFSPDQIGEPVLSVTLGPVTPTPTPTSTNQWETALCLCSPSHSLSSAPNPCSSSQPCPFQF